MNILLHKTFIFNSIFLKHILYLNPSLKFPPRDSIMRDVILFWLLRSEGLAAQAMFIFGSKESLKSATFPQLMNTTYRPAKKIICTLVKMLYYFILFYEVSSFLANDALAAVVAFTFSPYKSHLTTSGRLAVTTKPCKIQKRVIPCWKDHT